MNQTSQSGYCPVCSNPDVAEKFQAKVMHKYTAVYYYCNRCNFLYVKSPYWLEEAYQDPVNIYDVGVLSRNISLSRKTAVIISLTLEKNKHFLDYSGGYGIFTRLMRDSGFDFYWSDPYCQNLFARGFEKVPGAKTYEAVTLFEVMEHLPNPYDVLDEIFQMTDTLILTTTPLPDGIPEPGKWDYYALEHGQHISFYSLRTLRTIAEKYQAQLFDYEKDCFVITRRKIRYRISKMLIQYLHINRLYKHARKRLKSKTSSDARWLLTRAIGGHDENPL